MSVQQCEECRLALVRVVFDPSRGESDAWGCQLDETFSDQTRDAICPFFVGWAQALPPPARSCKKSAGKINGCSTESKSCGGSCSTSGGCGSGGCGLGDPADALDVKWDPEAEHEAVAADEIAAAAMHAHADHDHDHDHPHGPEQTGEGPREGDVRHLPSPPKKEHHVDPEPHEPAREAPAPGVAGDPSIPEGHAPEPADDGYPTAETKSACATACGALKALDRMGLGRDEDAPVPLPLEDDFE